MGKSKGEILRYASYGRCSSDDQKHKDFTTVQVQHELNGKKIAELGGSFAGGYDDEGKTGTNLNRPGWKRLLADAQAHKFEAVLITYMSRLGRGDSYIIAEYELKKAGVSVVLVQEQFTEDLAGYVGQRFTNLMDGVYPKMVSQWTRTKLQQMVEHGYRCGGTTPYGYRKEEVEGSAMVSTHDNRPPKRLVVDEEAAPFVRRAFDTFVETGSLARVAEYLEGVSGRPWTVDMARYLLRNESYRGVYVFGQWRNDAAHEPLISEAVWEAAQARERMRRRAPKRVPKDTASFYLRGLIHCKHCDGSRLTPANHHGRTATVRYYECIVNTKRRKHCPVRRVNAATVHEEIIDQIERAAFHSSRMAELLREATKQVPQPDGLAEQLQAIDRRIRETKRKTENCLAAVERGGAGLKVILGRIDDLEAERLSLLEQRAQVELQIAESKLNRPTVEQVQATWRYFLALWEKADEAQRQRLLPCLVERVDLEDKERGIVTLSLTGFKNPVREISVSENVVIKSDKGRMTGLEPATSRATTWRSWLSYGCPFNNQML